ncbi:MAG: penicillin-binding protein activator [Deltaproteobacteria bacterium]|nr:penicillin-binding protein activator [Deltaproteobacteria bacterium]
MVRLVCALLLIGCGPKVAPSAWTEHESTQRHESRAGSSAAPIDLTKLDDATIDELDEATASATVDALGDKAPAAQVALRAARLAHHRGDDASARVILAKAATAADEARWHAALLALAADVAAVPVTDTVAVLLPLTGRYSTIGVELRAAIELVPDVKWKFIDTRGEPEGAAAAVEQAHRAGAIAILGPVGTREAVSAARAAALHDIPIGLLAPADGADPSAGVFRLVTSPADEGRAVAELAQTDSFPSVGVFAPRDDIGKEAADAFIAEAKRRGLAVTADATYDPTGGDLEPDVKELLNLVPARNPRLAEHLAHDRKHGWQTFSPDVPFSLLYIPDRYDRAALVAAFLPYFNVELRTQEFPDQAMLSRKHSGHMPQVVQLVGGAGWHHPSLPVRGGTSVQGALILDVFPGDLGGDVSQQLGAAFQAKTGRPPSSAAAEAYDAAMMIAAARHGATTRAGMRANLARAHLDDGACGRSTMDVDGEVLRAPTILEVSGDSLVVAP